MYQIYEFLCIYISLLLFVNHAIQTLYDMTTHIAQATNNLNLT